MRKIFLVVLIMNVCLVAQGTPNQAENGDNSITKKNRNYPGGRDETDLVIQEQIKTPVIELNRQIIEQKVLKGNVKKEGKARGNRKDKE